MLFVVGSDKEPAGLYAAASKRPVGPELVVDLWGDEFDAAYRKAEEAGLARKTIPARDLYGRMMRTLALTFAAFAASAALAASGALCSSAAFSASAALS